MPTRSILDRLSAGDRILMDGATGSELQRRGADVLEGASGDRLGCWTAMLNLDSPDLVRKVHEDYLKVGAEIIISNSFWTSRTRLGVVGLADAWQDYARAAGRLAVEARDALNPEAYVAGGMAPPSMQSEYGRDDSDVALLGKGLVFDEFAAHAKVLADAGVDVLLPEYIGHIEDSVTAVDACATAGLPVLLGVRHISADGGMQYGESLRDLGAALQGHPVDAVLLMCSRPEGISPGLPLLRQSLNVPLGAYPNVGYNPLAPLRGTDPLQPDPKYAPERLAEFAGHWVELGAQIVGGCCGTAPAHIEAMRGTITG